MKDTAILVENLGKKYLIRHQRTERYAALRDVMMERIKSLGQRLLTPLNGQSNNSTREEFWALKDVSFEVQQGEVLGIIGRNGAGKSTLLKILSRVIEPTKGRVVLEGRVSSLLEVGTGFHPELTGRENIYLNGIILGMTRTEIRGKFDEIVAFAEVEKFLDTPVKRYSSGMCMRLAFAVAAHLETDILMMDEVLAVGDAEFQKKCLGKMGEVASRDGRTVIFVSHSMGTVNQLCTRTLWLADGKLMAAGNTAEIISRYLTNNTSAEGKCAWKDGISSAGVNEFKLFSISVLAPNGEISSNLDIQKPFTVRIHYKFYRDLPFCRVGFLLRTPTGTTIFEVYDADEEPWAGQRRAGEYMVHCEVPADLLRPGRYTLTISAGMPGVKNFVNLESVLTLDFEETRTLNSLMLTPRSGIIFPKVKWKQ